MMRLEIPQERAPRAASSFVREHHRYDRMLAGFERAMLDAAGLRSGNAVFDVGSGAGTTSLRAARRVGPEGCVLGVDDDRDAVDLARIRARDAGISWARFRCGDAAAEPLADGVFDAVVSRFGTLHFVDPAAAFANLRRALRLDGLLVFVCARNAERNPWATRPLGALRSVLPALPALDARGGPFALAEPGTIRHHLKRAGFRDVALVSLDQSVYLGDDLDDALEFFFETDGRALGDALELEQLARAADALRSAIAPWMGERGVWAPASAWLVAARA